jgi:hypothetical protein
MASKRIKVSVSPLNLGCITKAMDLAGERSLARWIAQAAVEAATKGPSYDLVCLMAYAVGKLQDVRDTLAVAGLDDGKVVDLLDEVCEQLRRVGR